MDSLSNSINDIAINDDKNEINETSVSGVSVLEKFKTATFAMIAEKNITIPASPTIDVYNEKTINNFLHAYTKNLSQKDKDSLVCEYGMTKAYKLYYDFHRIALTSTPEDFCEVFEYTDYGIDREIIELIISEAIGYNTDWRKDDDGRFTK